MSGAACASRCSFLNKPRHFSNHRICSFFARHWLACSVSRVPISTICEGGLALTFLLQCAQACVFVSSRVCCLAFLRPARRCFGAKNS